MASNGMASRQQEVASSQGWRGGHTHVTLQHELLAPADAEQDALALLHLRLLHRVDLLHGEQGLLGGQAQPRPRALTGVPPPRSPPVPCPPYRRLALPAPLQAVGEEVEVAALPLRQEGVAQLGHVAVHDAVLAHGVLWDHGEAGSAPGLWPGVVQGGGPRPTHPPRGPAACSWPSCEPPACRCRH